MSNALAANYDAWKTCAPDDAVRASEDVALAALGAADRAYYDDQLTQYADEGFYAMDAVALEWLAARPALALQIARAAVVDSNSFVLGNEIDAAAVAFANDPAIRAEGTTYADKAWSALQDLIDDRIAEQAYWGQE